jgi:glycosyltransferase involved in cell wall biosynthesis
MYNSVDFDRFQNVPSRREARFQLGLPQDAPILICIASLEVQKGHACLIEAMLKVRAACPRALLLLVGNGGLRRKLEKDVEIGQLLRNVTFLGHRTDIPLLLAAADLFVLPSLWEGFGLVLAEAGASGLPAVATSVDGIPEIIKHRVTGLLVQPGNKDLLAEAIVTLLQDDRRRLEMGEQALNLMKERFSMSAVAERMASLYLSLLPAGHRSASTDRRTTGV